MLQASMVLLVVVGYFVFDVITFHRSQSHSKSVSITVILLTDTMVKSK